MISLVLVLASKYALMGFPNSNLMLPCLVCVAFMTLSLVIYNIIIIILKKLRSDYT